MFAACAKRLTRVRASDRDRSPWSNTYDPPDGEAVLPSDELRKLEVKGNEVFQQYCGQ